MKYWFWGWTLELLVSASIFLISLVGMHWLGRGLWPGLLVGSVCLILGDIGLERWKIRYHLTDSKMIKKLIGR